MSAGPSLSPEETVRLGKEIYQRVVLPKLKPDTDDKGRIVAIDVRSEAWAIGQSASLAADKLRAERPSDVYLVRVGYAAYHRMGGYVSQTRK
jgi:hypothetical protein